MNSESSELLKTALSVIDGYNKWDIEAILAPRAPNCTQQVIPARLDRPSLTNSQYREFFSSIIPIFKGFHVTILDIVEDEKNNKVAFHAKSQAQTAIGEYANEYMIVIHMTEDRKKVVNIKEFVDSGYSQDFFTKLRAHGTDQNESQAQAA